MVGAEGASLRPIVAGATAPPPKACTEGSAQALPARRLGAGCGCAGCEGGKPGRAPRACALWRSQPSRQYACVFSPSPSLPLPKQGARGIVGAPPVGGGARMPRG